MNLYYLFVTVYFFTSASVCVASPINSVSVLGLQNPNFENPNMCDKIKGYTVVPTYALYLIGFIMLFMLIAIIYLAVRLYKVIFYNKHVFDVNVKNKDYIRQESTGIMGYSNHLEEDNKENGSTLTVNSGLIEISTLSDPVTPTRMEDSKIIFTKKTLKPMVPIIQRGQMDEICKEVLRKVQKSDSASFRDLNELLNAHGEEKYKAKVELEKKQVSKNEVKNEAKHVVKNNAIYEEKSNVKKEEKNDGTHDLKSDTNPNIVNDITANNNVVVKHDTKNEIKPNQPEKICGDMVEGNYVQAETRSDDEGESSDTEYDTVPSPVRYRQTETSSDNKGEKSETEGEYYDTVPNPVNNRQAVTCRDNKERNSEIEGEYYDTVPNPVNNRQAVTCSDNKERNSEIEGEYYDTVPNPFRYRHSGDDDDVDSMPVYDLPPSRSLQGPSTKVVQMDLYSNYLLPLSADKTDSCYINAKTSPLHKSA